MKLIRVLLPIITLVSLVGGGVLWAAVIISKFGEFQFQFNIFALLSLASVLINTFLIAILWRRIQSSETGFWFLMFLGATAFWAAAEFLQRISALPELAFFWQSIAIFGWACMPFAYLFFVLSYTDNQVIIRKLPLQAGIFIMITGLVYAQFNTGLTISSTNTLESWGYDSINGPYLNVFTIWLITLFLSALGLLIREYRQSTSVRKRKQIKLLIIAVLIPLVGGSLTDLILPNVFHQRVVPTATFLTAIEGLIIGYGIFRSQLFNINPVSLSGAIMETLPQPVIGTDDSFEIQFMNANAKKMFKQYEPFLGKHIEDLVGHENTERIKGALTKASPDEVINIDRIPLGLKEGVVIAQVQISKIKEGGEGYIFGMSNITQQVLTMRTIEREVRARTDLYNQEKARLLASVNGLRQGFLITNSEHRIVLMNKQAQVMFPQVQISNVQSGHVVGRTKAEVLEESLGGIKLEEWLTSVIRSNHYAEFNSVNVGKLVLDIDILPISMDDGAIGAAVLFDDVTERALTERSKDEFFSIASHELRTPLTAIRGNTSMMLNYYGEKLDNDLKEMVNDIHTSSLRLIEIVNDFLDTSRLEQGRMQFNMQDFPMVDIITKVVKETTPVAKEGGNIIKVDPGIADLPFVHADSNKLEQVIYNLIGNALKFTENGKVIIQGAVLGNQVKIRISDSGRGISQEGKKLLFRKFQQTGSNLLTRDTTKGTGLGLYISKLILENMHGTIGLEHSEPGVGTAFFFTVPVAEIHKQTDQK